MSSAKIHDVTLKKGKRSIAASTVKKVLGLVESGFEVQPPYTVVEKNGVRDVKKIEDLDNLLKDGWKKWEATETDASKDNLTPESVISNLSQSTIKNIAEDAAKEALRLEMVAALRLIFKPVVKKVLSEAVNLKPVDLDKKSSTSKKKEV